LLQRSTHGTLELSTRQGPRQAEVGPTTEIRDGMGSTLTLVDLRPGDILAVFGSLGNGRRFLADRILRVSAPAPAQP
jgi:ABC-type sugar transport system ATPase subunit